VLLLQTDVFFRETLMKYVILILLLIILASLGSGLFFLIRDKSNSNRTVKALTVRIALSLGLFILLMIGYATGLITPNGSHLPAP